jgi:hypothetical protein
VNTNLGSLSTSTTSTNPLVSMLSRSSTTPTSAVSSLLLQAITSTASTPPSVAVAGINTTTNNSFDQQQNFLALFKAATANEEERRRMLQQSLLLLSAANTAGISASTNTPLQSPPSPPPPSSLPCPLDISEQPTVFRGAEVGEATSSNNNVNNTSTGAYSAIVASTNQHVFPWKLHKMLEEAPAKNFNHIVSWVQNGTAFKVHNAQGFLANVIYQYFDQSKYESFRRQLNLYGFTRVVRGQHRGVYSHPFFRQGHQDWCRYITRTLPSQPQQQHQQGNGGREKTLTTSASAAVYDIKRRGNSGSGRTDMKEHDNLADANNNPNSSLPNGQLH